jgi:hypothetical protein
MVEDFMLFEKTICIGEFVPTPVLLLKGLVLDTIGLAVKLAVMTISLALAPTFAVAAAAVASEKVTLPDPVVVQPLKT